MDPFHGPCCCPSRAVSTFYLSSFTPVTTHHTASSGHSPLIFPFGFWLLFVPAAASGSACEEKKAGLAFAQPPPLGPPEVNVCRPCCWLSYDVSACCPTHYLPVYLHLRFYPEYAGCSARLGIGLRDLAKLQHGKWPWVLLV